MKFHQNDNPFANKDLLVKCFLTITCQTLITWYRIKDAIAEAPEIEIRGPELMMAKLVCACFMHLQLYPEVKITIDMMNYALSYPTKF